MEILQFLLNKLFGDNNNLITQLLDLFAKNGFDLKKVLASLDLNTIAPLVETLFSFAQNNNRPTETVGRYSGVNPIIKFADKDIVYSLNKYLCD